MRYAYYPGCSLEGTAKEYDLSTRATFRALGIELEELPDWSCCGASSAHTTNHLLAVALPTRNLVIAEKQGLDLVAPCAACFNRLVTAQHKMEQDARLKGKVEQVVEGEYQGTVKVKAVLEVLATDFGVEKVREMVTKPLKGLRVASYYGCLLVRPPEVTKFDDPENPTTMDALVEASGAEAVMWPHKTECCGGSFAFARVDIVEKLSNDILAAAKSNGADCIATACPLCQANLDMRQKAIEKQFGTTYNMPIYYITELLGLALGLEPRSLGLGTHMVESLRLLREKELA